MTEADVLGLLRKRYGGDEWAFLTHVPQATGAAAGRTADALAMNLWPSRGLAIHGFEVKVSRSDWLREMKNPAKAESIARYCHFWWIVIADRTMVKEGELPHGWGLLEAKGARVTQVVAATERTPDQVGPKFLAALLRRATQGSASVEEIKAAEDAGYERGRAAGELAAAGDRAITRARVAEDRYRQLVATFAEHTGILIDRWQTGLRPEVAVQFADLGYSSPAQIADAVREVLQAGRCSPLQRLQRERQQVATGLARVLADYDETIAELNSPQGDLFAAANQ